MKAFKQFLAVSFILLLSGCLSGKHLRGKPGTVHGTTATATATANQPESAKGAATVSIDSETETTLSLHSGDVVRFSQTIQSTNETSTNTISVDRLTVLISKDSVLSHKSKDKVRASSGSAREDKAGEIAAKMELGNVCLYIGAGLMIVGLAMAFIPWLTAIVRSRTFGLIIFLAGAVFASFPFLIIGNETQILLGLGTILAVVVYYFVHRHGQHSEKAALADKFLEGKI